MSDEVESKEAEGWEESDRPSVILSLCFSGGFLGAAAYYQESTTIKMLRDIGEDADYRTVDALLYQIEPTAILLNKGQDIFYIRHVSQRCGVLEIPEKDIETDDANQEGENTAAALINSYLSKCSSYENNEDPDEEDEADSMDKASIHLLPNAAYQFEAASKRITQLFASECFSDCEKSLVLNFRLDTNSVNMIRALGALLRYMDSTRTGVEYESLNKTTPVTAMNTMVVEEMMEIDSTTYRALEIFGENRKKEISWKKVMSSDGRKASLFSLCNRSRSTPGRNMLRKWFEHPTMNIERLKERQNAISYFVQESNSDTVTTLHQCLGHIRSLRLILRRMRSSSCQVPHWENMFKTLLSLVDIGRCMKEKDIKLSIMNDSMKYFGDELSEITTVIATLCDFDESRLENRLVVKSGIDSELDEIKHIYRQLPAILTRVAKEEADRLQAERCSVGYIPMVGYILQLPNRFPVENYPDLQLLFSNDNDINVKSDKMEKLDQDLGDLKMQIIDKETTIMLRLQKLILKGSSLILGACNGAAILDAVISLAMTARYYGWTRPSLVTTPVIEASEVVHPLALLVSKKQQFVANPVRSGQKYTNVKIFTGPNACGKSVYLKQVGVLAFLAHIGSFVPAERAVIGPINRIMTRMYTVDGVLDGMSTFAKDLTQVASALRRGNQMSLVIIDEFGKGTMTEVGLSLLTSSLNYWIRKGKEGCPHLFVASHFHALPKLIEIDESIVSFNTLEVIRRGAQLDFKFRLVEGIVNKSFAAYTASKMGIEQSVVDRANEVYELLRKGVALSEVKAMQEEEEKCNWLAERMDNFMYELETWDIDNTSLEHLISRIEEVFLDEDETLTAVDYNKVPKPSYLEEDLASEPSSEHQQSQLPSCEKANTDSCSATMFPDENSQEKSMEEVCHSEVSEKSESSCPETERSILKTLSSRSRGNLSVSFMIEENDTEKKVQLPPSENETALNVTPVKLAEEDIIIPLYDSDEDDILHLDDNANMEFSFSKNMSILDSEVLTNSEKKLENTDVSNKVAFPMKRTVDLSLISLLPGEKSVPLKRLRSC